jgi:catechol 2,3-dioxygenase-like lactoylglutathione lyase family enzyme
MGWSPAGTAFAVGLLVPMLVMLIRRPTGTVPQPRFPAAVRAVEPASRVAVLVLLIISADAFDRAPDAMLWAAVAAVAVHLGWWACSYFGHGRSPWSLFAPLGPLPVPLAVLPVLALFLFATWGRSVALGVAALVFGAAHVVLSRDVARQLQPCADRARLYAAHPVFPVPDVARSAAFYRDVLGFRPVEYLDAAEPHVCLYRDGVEIILTSAPDVPVVPHRVRHGFGYDAYLITDQQAALHRELTEAGATVVRAPAMTDYHNMELVVEDADGRWLGFGIKGLS